MPSSNSKETLERIHAALEEARTVLNTFTPGAIDAQYKVGNDPVTEADRLSTPSCKKNLLRPGEGWLSEETVDDFTRLENNVAGSSIRSTAPANSCRAFPSSASPSPWSKMASLSPAESAIPRPTKSSSARGTRHNLQWQACAAEPTQNLNGALVLASRSEVKRGEWKQFEGADFNIRPMGSVAYKLGLVSAGLADLTFTLVPKNEWDVAAGAALVESAGGWTLKLDHTPLRCNQKNPLISGLLAGGPFLRAPLLELLERHAQASRT